MVIYDSRTKLLSLKYKYVLGTAAPEETVLRLSLDGISESSRQALITLAKISVSFSAGNDVSSPSERKGSDGSVIQIPAPYERFVTIMASVRDDYEQFVALKKSLEPEQIVREEAAPAALLEQPGPDNPSSM